MDKAVVTALGRIPLFEGMSEEDMSAERLGGLTNRNYRIESPAGRFVLRLAGEGTAEYIDRAVEEHNARVAAGAGVNAQVDQSNFALILIRPGIAIFRPFVVPEHAYIFCSHQVPEHSCRQTRGSAYNNWIHESCGSWQFGESQFEDINVFVNRLAVTLQGQV